MTSDEIWLDADLIEAIMCMVSVNSMWLCANVWVLCNGFGNVC